jgi:hypothetical protein
MLEASSVPYLFGNPGKRLPVKNITVSSYLLMMAREEKLNLVIGPGCEKNDLRPLKGAGKNLDEIARLLGGIHEKVGSIDIIRFPSRREPFHEKAVFDHFPTRFESGTVKAETETEDVRTFADEIARALRFRLSFSRRSSGEITVHVDRVDARELFAAIARALNVQFVERGRGDFEFR